jgi:hypothetical protein
MDARTYDRQRRALAALALCALAAGACGCGPGDAPANYFFFPIDEGTPVDITLTGIDADADTTVSVKVRDTLLTAPGETAEIGIAVEGVHIHPEWLATIPGGADPDQFGSTLSFIIDSPSAVYAASGEYTVSFELVADSPEEPEETEILLGATRVGGGQLAAQYAFAEPIQLFYDQCIGGTGDDCLGGVVLYSSPNPGFAPRE